MPTYTYKCKNCNALYSRVMRMSDHVTTIDCECGDIANQVILSPPLITIPQHMRYDFDGYQSPVTGRHISNMRDRANDLAASNCIEYDPGMRQDTDRKVKERENELDRSVDETVERAFESMTTQQKENLGKELTAGIDAEVIRV